MALTAAVVTLSSVCVYATPVVIFLQVGYDDPEIGHGGPSKNPPITPVVSIEGNDISFDASCHGSMLQLMDGEGNTVYSALITSNTLTLPSTLTGTYELRLQESGSTYYYYGYINL